MSARISLNGVELNQILSKEKNESKQKTGKKLSLKQRLAQQVLQKQLQVLNLKEWLIVLSFIFGAAALRVPMQAIPSAEPITFFAILTGWLFGKKKGFLVGAGALYASNFLVFGGQGIWTLFQALGFGMAGFLGGFLPKKAKIWSVLLITILATILFEFIVNIGLFFMFPNIITAISFGIIHLVSNTIFAFLLPQIKRTVYEKGQFNQKEICKQLLKKFEDIKRGRK